jgi:hypothetical protein
MALPTDPEKDDLELVSGSNEDPIYRHIPTGKFCTLMHEGYAKDKRGGQVKCVEWHDTQSDAESYMRGVQDGTTALDFRLDARRKEDY